MTELQILDRFREETNSWAVLIAMLKKEPTTMDEAWRIAWKLRKHPLAWTSDITFPMTDEWRNYQSPVSFHLLTGQSSTSSRREREKAASTTLLDGICSSLTVMSFGQCNALGTEEERFTRLKELFQRPTKLKLKI
ncbi:putative membrane protein [Trichinella pseudospiralis]